jgi:hypothetical protein
LLGGYLEEEITSFVAEDALQYLLKFEDNIPFVKPAFSNGYIH